MANNDASTAAAISALGSVGTAVVNSSGKKKSQERANKYNIEMWNMQNAYNSPASQMARLREAGLNPNLIYGGSGSTQVGNADSPAKMESDFHPMDNPIMGITKYADAKKSEATTDNLKAQNTVLTQEALLKASQTAKSLAEGQSAGVKAQIDKEMKNTSMQIMTENLRGMEQQTLGRYLDNTLKDQSIKPQLMRLGYEVENAKANLEGTQLQNALKKYELELNQYGISKGDNLFFRILGRHYDDAKKYIQSFKN